MVIEAGAGTGKTTSLRMLSDSTPRRGVYIAYNRAIAQDAKGSFPGTTKCGTAHSFAYATHGVPMKSRLAAPRMWGRQIANALGIHESFQVSDESTLFPAQIASIVMETVGHFCNSADADLTRYHVPHVDNTENKRDQLQALILPYAIKAWADLCSKNGKLKFNHDHYLKQWALTNPRLNADYVLLDEAQDANPVIAKVVQDQQAQQIMVGDRSQAIYGWRGAVDAMSTFKADHHLILSQSFRFGQAIADEANKWLDILDAPLRLKGFDQIDSKIELVDSPKAILCRTNATCIAEALAAQDADKRVAIVGGTAQIASFTKAAERLMGSQSVDHPDLVAFGSWDEVENYVNNEKAGADLRVMVTLIRDYGTGTILDVCNASVDEKAADLIVSTAHKAKGREWDTVRIAGDFREPNKEEDGKISAPEAMLAYVSVTRAKTVLDNSGLAWVDGWV